MNTFELEQKLQKEYGDVNLVKSSEKGTFITTLKGRSCFSEVVNEKRIYYKDKKELYLKSEQFATYKSLVTLEIEMKGTDSSKWEVKKID